MANVERLKELRNVIASSDDYSHCDPSLCAAGHAVHRTSYADPHWYEKYGHMPAAQALLGLTDQEAESLFYFETVFAMKKLRAFEKDTVLVQIDILIEAHSPEYAAPVDMKEAKYLVRHE